MSLPVTKEVAEPLIELILDQGWPIPELTTVSAESLPADVGPYFIHTSCMTSHLETLFRTPIKIDVICEHHTESRYLRLVLLRGVHGGLPLLLGALDVSLDRFAEPVRNEIEAAQKPFGKILTDRAVKHDFQPEAYFTFNASSQIARILELPEGIALYARRKLVIGDDRPLAVVTEIPARFRLPGS